MGKFKIKKAKNEEFMFNLLASNGQVICSSQMYKALPSAKNGIESVKKNCCSAVEDQTVEGFEKLKNPKYELYTDNAGEFRFRLKAGNGEIIAVSEGYKSKAGALNGIDSIQRNAPDAEVVEELE
ncbi:MAG: YegP family protein [Candidatus Methanomethylophilaceae archaeon]|nr:YegP family protein [Candidatus Methanomethylophilaceae archaeon]